MREREKEKKKNYNFFLQENLKKAIKKNFEKLKINYILFYLYFSQNCYFEFVGGLFTI